MLSLKDNILYSKPALERYLVKPFGTLAKSEVTVSLEGGRLFVDKIGEFSWKLFLIVMKRVTPLSSNNLTQT
jgi:hypothetical protein